MTTFKELGLSKDLLKSTEKMGFEEATPIQAEAIPVAFTGKDLIGQAQTGTGKTAAFGIPMIEKIDVDNPNIQGIVIAPTRELAIQVSEELQSIGRYKRIHTLAIFGGQEISRQIRALKRRPQIIVGTPGRLLDHLRRRTIRLKNIETVVLDEADEMLNMGFIEDIESILKEIPEEHQTLLFSATMPPPIRRIAERFMKSPEVVKVKQKEMTVPQIEQYYIELQEKKKFDALTRLLDIQSPKLAIVFGRTKRRVDELSKALNIRGYAAEGIHGDLSQARRSTVLKKFKDRTINVLVATDVAARGLDISGVSHVYNFDIPQDPESYVHRIGRTGRAGQAGLAISFITHQETAQLHNIENTTKKKMERKPLPTIDDAIKGQREMAVSQLLKTMQKKELTNYTEVAEELLEKYDAVSLVSAALKMLTNEPNSTPVKLTSEAPVIVKKGKKRSNQSSNRKNNKGLRRKHRTPRGDHHGGNKSRGNFKKRYHQVKAK